MRRGGGEVIASGRKEITLSLVPEALVIRRVKFPGQNRRGENAPGLRLSRNELLPCCGRLGLRDAIPLGVEASRQGLRLLRVRIHRPCLMLLDAPLGGWDVLKRFIDIVVSSEVGSHRHLAVRRKPKQFEF